MGYLVESLRHVDGEDSHSAGRGVQKLKNVMCEKSQGVDSTGSRAGHVGELGAMKFGIQRWKKHFSKNQFFVHFGERGQ